jgi:DDE superfamily endonuclease
MRVWSPGFDPGIAYRLYLPEIWANDAERREKAHVPEDVEFRTKPRIALAQIEAALKAGVARGVVLTDVAYGSDGAFRAGVTALGLIYAAGVQSTLSVWPPGEEPLPPKPWSGQGRKPSRLRHDADHRPISAKELAMRLPAEAWNEVEWREGSNQPLSSRFAALRVRPALRDHKLVTPHPVVQAQIDMLLLRSAADRRGEFGEDLRRRQANAANQRSLREAARATKSTFCAAGEPRALTKSAHRGSRTYLDRGKSHRQYDRIAHSLPRMNDVGSEYDIVASRLKHHLFLRSANVKRDSQTALDQYGDRGAVSIGPRTGPLVSVRVDAPLELDVGLAPQSELRGNKLAEEPSAVAHLVGLSIAKVEAFLVAHSHFPMPRIAGDRLTNWGTEHLKREPRLSYGGGPLLEALGPGRTMMFCRVQPVKISS